MALSVPRVLRDRICNSAARTWPSLMLLTHAHARPPTHALVPCPPCSLSTLSKLRELKLYDNRISQISGGLQGLSTLHTLDLSSNRLTDLQV